MKFLHISCKHSGKGCVFHGIIDKKGGKGEERTEALSSRARWKEKGGELGLPLVKHH